MRDRSPTTRGVLLGLIAAVSFGISAPLAKLLLDDVRPQMLAGLLYVGAFVGLSLALVRRRSGVEAPLRRTDAPRLLGLIVTGGVVAPVLMLIGLERISGVTGSLLLNLEAPFTIIVGVALFREHLPRQAALGAGIIFVGAFVLGLQGGQTHTDWLGILLIAAACACWAVDNNLTQSLTVREPLSVVRLKAGAAGAVNVVIALLLNERFPELGTLAAVLALGAVSYGFSVYLDALALRLLGAAREAAIFAVAPFAGALLAPLVLPDVFGVQELVAGLLMAGGVVLLLTDHHVHEHAHGELTHEHGHVHDEHHHHEHAAEDTELIEPHSHVHAHEPLRHSHPHVSDTHHRHRH